jgi:hypothetical protein
VPGRKTDVLDAHWLALLARAGLLRASRADIFEALQAEEVTPAHRFCLDEIRACLALT